MSCEMLTFAAIGVFAGIASVDPSDAPRGATEEAVADTGLLAAHAGARKVVAIAETAMTRIRDFDVFMIVASMNMEEQCLRRDPRAVAVDS